MTDPDKQKKTTSRGKLSLSVNEYVRHIPTNRQYRISKLIDHTYILAADENGQEKVLKIEELGLPETNITPYAGDLDQLEDELWEEAKYRHELIQPLLKDEIAGRTAIEAYAKEKGVGYSSLYRWLRVYKTSNSISSLISRQRGWLKGASRLNQETEKIIKESIQKYYLSEQRLSPIKVIQQIRVLCHQQGIKPPADNSIRKRMSELSEKEVLRRRGYKEKAKNKFQPKPGRFPDVSYPLDVIQIDHTPMDIILVDDKTRQAIGRPWLTVAIDVYSRMICGYYLSLDAPSEISVAMCIAHCVLPKEEWLSAKGVNGEWKVWGLPKKIHVDNGMDFRTETLKRACLEYGITLEHRPVRVPNYGGHIERLIGTLMRESHQLAGTTFSNIKEKDNYKSVNKASFTFDELEEWLLNLIVNIYHKRIHRGIEMRPEDKWDLGIFGNGREHIGCGLPDIPVDKERLMLDFMPFTYRTIQANGVTWDGVRYFDFCLAPFIGKSENGKSCEYLFRRDPRNVAVIYFFNPNSKSYVGIPAADQKFPRTSVWQLRETKKRLRELGRKNYNRHQLIEAIQQMSRLEDSAQQKTLKARRKRQRNVLHDRQITPIQPDVSRNLPPVSEIAVPDVAVKVEIKPFEDIE